MGDCLKTILLVDDDSNIRQLLGVTLRREGYRILEAGNGLDALRKCQRCDELVDLLLTDVMMPEMDGWELADAVRVLQPQVKVLFISGYADGLPHTALQSCSNLLPKPFSMQALIQMLREMLLGQDQGNSASCNLRKEREQG